MSWELPESDTYCSPGLCEYLEHVCNRCGCLAVCCGLGLARKQMQPAIHALRAAADSSVKYDGVADYPASLSLPWLASWAADWVCSIAPLYTQTKWIVQIQLRQTGQFSKILEERTSSTWIEMSALIEITILSFILKYTLINNHSAVACLKRSVSVVVKDHLAFKHNRISC